MTLWGFFQLVTDDLNANYISRMLTSDEFPDTRSAYLERDLGYADLVLHHFLIAHSNGSKRSNTAVNLEKFIGVLAMIRAKSGNLPKTTPYERPSRDPSIPLIYKLMLCRRGALL